MNTDPKFTEKEFNDELKKLFKKERLESPSFRFTEDVMAKVRVEVKIESYQPVISRLGWVIVSFFILAVFVFALFTPASASAPAWLSGFSGFLDSGKLDIQFLDVFTKFFSELHASELLLPLTGLLLAMGFHGLVMKRFYFPNRKNIPGAFMF